MTKTTETATENAMQKTEQLAMSERFTNTVLREFGGNVSGAMQVTDYQRTLIQGYFIAIDRALKAAEEERIRKNGKNTDSKYNNDTPVSWNTVNLNDLALDLVHYARLGLDMTQENMLFPIPYKNNKRNNYDITLMEGYNGIRYIAEKYAVEVPKAVTIEVVYSTDVFRPIKKGKGNSVESYEFEIMNPFDRGDIVGGFAYLEFSDPTRNELIIMSMRDIEKRKPKYAAAEFWGGTKKIWENGKQVEVQTEGWVDEMVRKTIIRETYSAKHLPRDPRKIDDTYQYLKLKEARIAEVEVQAEINAQANSVLIAPAQTALLTSTVVDTVTGEIIEESVKQPVAAAGTATNAETPTF